MIVAFTLLALGCGEGTWTGGGRSPVEDPADSGVANSPKLDAGVMGDDAGTVPEDPEPVDPGAVTLTWALPAPNAIVSGVTEFKLTGQNLVNVEIFLGGNLVARCSSSADLKTATASIDTTKLTNGAKTFSAHAWNSPAGTQFTREADAGPRTVVIQNGAGDPCAGQSCSGHGTCQVNAGVATCQCAAGYTASGLSCVPNPSGAGVWMSGSFMSCNELGNWRGTPVAICGFSYNNGPGQDNRTHITLVPQWSPSGSYDVLEVTYSLIDRSLGETWATGASGALDGIWRQAMRQVYNSWGNTKWLFIRPAHEFNGQALWYVRAGDEANFKASWIRFYNIVQQELVSKGKQVFMGFCAAHQSWNNAVDVSDAVWPGDQYVDVVEVDYYDNFRHRDEASWTRAANSTTGSGNPMGLYTWQAFARRHGKPLALPEWGVHADYATLNDNPFFIRKMHEFFRANAGSGPGQVLFETYFDTWASNQLHPPTQLPNSAAMYKSLSWSTGSGVAWPVP